MNILLVENDPLQRLACEHQIRSLGFGCTSCPDAKTALEACHQTIYPLIVQDLELPDMDGLELCRRIRALAHEENSMILALSGRDSSKNTLAAFEAGANDYLSKPVSPELLSSCVIGPCSPVLSTVLLIQTAGTAKRRKTWQQRKTWVLRLSWIAQGIF